MTKTEFRNKFNELMCNAIIDMKKKSESLILSGALNIKKEDTESYRLVKCSLYAILKSVADEYRPLDPDNKKEAENIKHFV